ncbi:complement C5-like [Nannospalax galili]|uniref:complement C5-like n=1 Tax=Nannospalax galili TaxID=1026970 RepID=UPI00111BD449|nr:complement C5-like [Nannospalax galili]
MGLWGILWFLILLGTSWGQEQRYVILAPEVFHVGASENITIQAHGYTEAFDATISIKSYPDERVNYSSDSVNLSPENKFQNSANLTIQPTQLSGGENSTSYVYLEIVSKHFSKLKKMPVLDSNRSLFNYTDKFLYTPQHSDEAYEEITNSRIDVTATLKEEMEQRAARYKHPVLKKCCSDGAHLNHHETCEQRSARITIGPRCVRAFSECCVRAEKIRSKDTHKEILLGMRPEHSKELIRKRRDKMVLSQTIEEQAAKYRYPVVKKCCYDGARYDDRTCEERAAQVTIGPRCVRAFSDCCVIANHTFKRFTLHSSEINS